MADIKKIALACFIGGAICSLVALIFIATYWWLGLIAGLFGGYLGYDFREVLIAIPKAFSIAKKGSGKVFKSIWKQANKFFKAIYKWLNSPHPFLCPALALSITLFVFKALLVMPCFDKKLISLFSVFIAWIYVLGIVCLAMILSVIVYLMALFGADNKKEFCRHFIMGSYEAKNLIEKGYTEKPLTELNVSLWMLNSLKLMVICLFWTMWKYLIIGVCEGVCIIGKFLWNMLKIVYSRKRVLCAINGTLGGLVSLVLVANNATAFGGQILVVFFGGTLGATFGVINFEIVSKKILKVA